MSCSGLPPHGRITCSLCHPEPMVFDETRAWSKKRDWRITANPLAWGNSQPEVLVLGFSKGPNQAGELASLNHNDVPYRKGRKQVGRILAHVGLLPMAEPDELKKMVDRAIADTSGRFGWGSLIRCTVERFDTSHKIGRDVWPWSPRKLCRCGSKGDRSCSARNLASGERDSLYRRR